MILLRSFLFVLGLLLIASVGQSADRPNIMVFLVDDMGVMDTSVPFLTGEDGAPVRYPLNDFYRTPGMERLAAQGIRFNQFYAMSVCSPTRVSIMTGQNAARHRTTNWINPWGDNAGTYGPKEWNWKGLDSDDITLPGELRKAGYRTVHVGKAHFGPEESVGEDPARIGFDINLGGDSFGAPGSYYAEKNYGKGTKRDRSKVPHLDQYHGTDVFLTEALTLETKPIVKKAVSDGVPFYLYLSHYAVHSPFESDPRFAMHYKESGKSKNAQAFATLIEGMDKSLGDMLDCFEELQIAEDTLVIFLGDNGTDAPIGNQHEVACAAPLRGKKGAHYEGGMRVPFIAAWAKPDPANEFQKKLKIPAGGIQSQVASVEDLFPTILEIAGVPLPDSHPLDGKPLQTLLTGEADETRAEQFLMHYPHGRHRSNYFSVWRDGDWKLIYHALPDEPTTGNLIQFKGGHYQLFNLKDDPFESTNLALKNGEQLRKMVAGLKAELKEDGALFPTDSDGKILSPPDP